jgi:cell wall-associated NlpC family hydrolase
MRSQGVLAWIIFALCVVGCTPSKQPPPSHPPLDQGERAAYFFLPNPAQREEVVLFAYGLLNKGYRFGGRNPEAGLDCSGMVSYIVEEISGKRLPHNAAQIARSTRPIPREHLQPGDLVFFNTLNRPFSHMGIYLGGGRFVHSPSSRGRVRIERLDSSYFAPRFEGARTLVSPRP